MRTIKQIVKKCLKENGLANWRLITYAGELKVEEFGLVVAKQTYQDIYNKLSEKLCYHCKLWLEENNEFYDIEQIGGCSQCGIIQETLKHLKREIEK